MVRTGLAVNSFTFPGKLIRVLANSFSDRRRVFLLGLVESYFVYPASFLFRRGTMAGKII